MKHVWALEKVDYMGYYQTRDIEKQLLFDEEPTTAIIAKIISYEYPDNYGNQLVDLYTEGEIIGGIERLRYPHNNFIGWELTKKPIYKEKEV